MDNEAKSTRKAKTRLDTIGTVHRVHNVRRIHNVHNLSLGEAQP